MRKAAIGIGAIAAMIASPVWAADMPVKAPPPAAVAPHDWSGFYAGGNVGYGWGTANNNLSVSQAGGFGAPGIFVLSGTDSNRLSSVNGGAQAGYNLQSRNFLFGIEADIQAAHQRGSGAYNSAVLPIGLLGGFPFGPDPTGVSDSSKLDWFGTLRGRLGITSDRWLLYATGGLAYGEVNESGSALPANTFPSVANAPFLWNESATKMGWTIGAGIENALSSNWSWKIEYLYMDLGNVTANVSGGLGTSVGAPTPVNCYGTPGSAGCAFAQGAAQGNVTSRFTESIVRIGINYKIN